MTLPASIIHIPAGVPIDQSKREEHIQPGEANLYAENVRLNQEGSLVKRYGFDQLTNTRIGGNVRTTALRVAPFGDSVTISDGDILDMYSPASAKWAPIGRLPGCSAKRKAVASTSRTNNFFRANVVYCNGYYVMVSADPDPTYFSVAMIRFIDATTKRVVKTTALSESTTFTDIYQIQLAVVGTNVVVIYNGVGNNIYGQRIDMTTLNVGARQTIAADYAATVMDTHELSDRVAIAYQNTSVGTARITIKTLTPTLDALTTLETQTETTLAQDLAGIGLSGSEGLWLTWTYSTGTDFHLYASIRTPTSLGTAVAATQSTVDFTVAAYGVAACRFDSSRVYVAAFSGDPTVAAWFRARTARLSVSGGTITIDRENTYIGGFGTVSKPFVIDSRAYMELGNDTATSKDIVLCDITADASITTFDRNQTIRPVAWVAPRANVIYNSDDLIDPSFTVRRVTAKSATVMAVLHIVQTASVATSLCITEYDFDDKFRQLPLTFADCQYWSGGMFYRFDGERAYEAGFIVPPRVKFSYTGTGLTGTYLYTAIHEYTDAAGNVIWSSPAVVQTAVPVNQKVRIQVRRPVVNWMVGYDGSTDLQPQSQKRTKTKVYRTVNGGGEFYLVQEFQTTTLAIAQFDDSTSDASLITKAKLYKSPGTVGTAKDRQMFGACRHAVECNGVLVAIADDGTTLRCFAQRTVGEAPWHHDVLQMPIAGDGELVALAALDGSVIAFKQDEIYVVPVEASDDAVTQGGFGSPRRIAVDVGCKDPRSVVVTGLGVFFQSSRGIELLTRGLEVVYVGEKIQTTFAANPEVAAAVVDAANNIIRFSLAEGYPSGSGLDAIFDLSMKEWIGFDSKTGSVSGQRAESACVGLVAGTRRYMWLESDGVLHYESTDYKDKGDVFVVSKWEPAWVKLELQRETQFWQSILLFERESAAGLLAEVAFDWQDYSASDNKTYTESEIASYPHQVELRVTGRKQAVKYRFSDSAPVTVGTGQGLEFIGLSTDLAPHQGPTQGTPHLAAGARK